MNETPFFSILIPVYNASGTIDRCINAIIQQNFASFEVVLLDDGSTDESLLKCQSWQERFPEKIHTIHQENTGAVYARRNLLNCAKGTYLWFVDADDEISPDALAELYDILQKQPVGMLLFDCKTQNAAGNWVHEKQLPDYPKDYLFTPQEKEILYRYAIQGNLNSLWNKVFHRKCVDFAADYSRYKDLKKGNDRLQMLPLLTNAHHIFYHPKAFYLYYYNPSGLTRTFGQHTLDSVLTGLDILTEYADQWTGADQYRKEFALLRNRHIYQLLTQAFDACSDNGGFSSFRTYFSIITENKDLMKDYDFLPLEAIDVYARDVTKTVRTRNVLKCYGVIRVRKALHWIKEKLMH